MGASDKPSRASYFVATYLQSSTRYKVYFVNPVVKEILGEPTYPSLADLPESPASWTSSASTTTCRGCWRRPSLRAPRPYGCSWAPGMRTSPKEAEAAGLDVVMDRCVKIEHARFHGGLHLAGFDTGVHLAANSVDGEPGSFRGH